MKKIILGIALAGLAVASQAQGLIIFSTSTQNMQTNNTVPALGATASGKIQGLGNFYFALFYSASATTVGGSQTTAIQGNGGSYAFNDNNWTAISSTLATNTSTAGRFAAANPNADGSTTIPTIAAGSSAQFVVVGWSASLGTTLAQAAATYNAGTGLGFIGESGVSGAISTGNGGNLPTPNLFGGIAPQLQGFVLGSIAPVPEPGTMALAALGGASLLLFRRRK